MQRLVWKLVIYLFAFYSFVGVVLMGLRQHYLRSYSPEAYEQMVSEVSKFRDVTDDPCKYGIAGEPVTNNYVKVTLLCGVGRKLQVTLSLEAINGRTVEDVLIELGRINNFNVEIDEQGALLALGELETGEKSVWNCLLNEKVIENFRLEVPTKGTIVCVYDSI